MSRAQWDPLKELAGVRERMNKLFESALARTNFDTDGGLGAWAPLADVCENTDCLRLYVELPGVGPEEIDLRLEGDDLLVQGERRMDRDEAGEQFHRVERSYGKFARRFSLPSNVDRGAVEAVFRDGVLRISFPKRESGGRGPVRVPIS